jgi:hypothetical protein
MAKTVIVKDFPEDLHHRIRVQVAKEKTTMKELIIRVLTEYLKRQGG